MLKLLSQFEDLSNSQVLLRCYLIIYKRSYIIELSNENKKKMQNAKQNKKYAKCKTNLKRQNNIKQIINKYNTRY